jgi:hypothetical protein
MHRVVPDEPPSVPTTSRRDFVVADLGGLVAGCHSVDSDPPVGELGNMWIRPSKIGTGLGRVLWQDAMATHGRPGASGSAFFRHRTPDQMLVTAAPWSSPWPPEGYGQDFWKAAYCIFELSELK